MYANEKEYIRKNGSRYPIRFRGFLITNTNGLKVVWGIIEDLTEIKRAEDKLIKSDTFIQTLLKTIPFGKFLISIGAFEVAL